MHRVQDGTRQKTYIISEGRQRGLADEGTTNFSLYTSLVAGRRLDESLKMLGLAYGKEGVDKYLIVWMDRRENNEHLS